MNRQQERQFVAERGQNPIDMFLFALRAPETKRQYMSRLRIFFDYIGLKGGIEEQADQFVVQSVKDPTWAIGCLMRFIRHQKERVQKKEITEASLRNYYKPIKLFCEMNDVTLSWKKIAKGIPRARTWGNDRAPAIDEIRTLIDYPDRRIKPIVYTMVSSGIRLGAWDYLRWGDIEPIMQDEKVVAAKMVVYRGDAEEYITFMTPEAYHALKDWMHYREMSGEKVTKDSWVMRNLWNVEHYHHGFVTKPRKLKSSGIKRLIERALWAQGLRKPLEDGRRRHEFKADHGFRKYFKTRAEQVMRPANVELLMGHNIGLSASYYKPTEREVLQDYLRAAELLTIDNTKSRAKADSEVLAKLHDRDELYSMVVDIIAEVMEKNGGSLKNS